MDEPITETRNDITTNIDLASPAEIVSLLQQCDAEVFNGWKGYANIFEESFMEIQEQIADIGASIITNPDGAIVLSGCGTSGRLAFTISRTFNMDLRKRGNNPCYEYIVAGNDDHWTPEGCALVKMAMNGTEVALFTPQEAPEDNPHLGAELLRQMTAGKKRVLYIGISCGLSAPFVAGQIEFCLSHPDVYIPVLLGFNPVSLSRNVPIEKWDKTFRQVAVKLETAAREGKGFILNPVVGPEPITGSSRMKGGTATKILLESIFIYAHNRAFGQDTNLNIKTILHAYREICERLYMESSDLAKAVEISGKCVNENGNIYYIGRGGLGIVGMIDASECLPTFGTSLDGVRGFIYDGYRALQNKEGDISHLGTHHRISVKVFEEEIVPKLTKTDLVVILANDNDDDICKPVLTSPCTVILVNLATSQTKVRGQCHAINVTIPTSLIPGSVSDYTPLFIELAAKLICNAISSGGFILKGKVCHNIMVDMKVSNAKLFHRSVGIIQKLTNLNSTEARNNLIRSIWSTDSPSDEQMAMSVVQHNEKATMQEMVVPVALLMSMLGCGIDAAVLKLQSAPGVRNAIMESIKEMKQQ